MSGTAIVMIVAIAASVGAMCGYVKGRQVGRDEQWIDDVIDAGRREIERRDKRGRFKRRARA